MKRDIRAALLAFTAILLLGAGCGGPGGEGAGAAGGGSDVSPTRGARLVFEIPSYVPLPYGAVRQMTCGGLFTAGDVNSDGWDDLFVGSGKYPGSMAAYSGRDGRELWRFSGLVGKAAEAAGEKGYQVRSFFPMGDVNGDGVTDIYFQNAWGRRRTYIVSGADGAILVRGDAGRVAPALASADFTGDGIPDVVTYYGLYPGCRVFSGTDLSEVLMREEMIDYGDYKARASWVIRRFDDLNGDGADELAVGYDTNDSQVVVFLSGKDFSEIRRISIEWDRVRAKRSYVCPGDVNGDTTPDLVKASAAGRAEEGSISYLAAYSGADGSTIWEILGTSLPGGPKRFRIDAKTGERTDLPGDVEFGEMIVAVPDLDGDSVQEVATVLPTVYRGKRTRGILVFSGASGKQVATYIHTGKDFRMGGPDIAVIKPASRARASVAVTGKGAGDSHAVAVFDLE